MEIEMVRQDDRNKRVITGMVDVVQLALKAGGVPVRQQDLMQMYVEVVLTGAKGIYEADTIQALQTADDLYDQPLFLRAGLPGSGINGGKPRTRRPTAPLDVVIRDKRKNTRGGGDSNRNEG